MATITLEYFGFTGSGRTVKEAKQDAGRKIEALHSDTWQPAIYEWRGAAVLVYRNLQGWQYSFILAPDRALSCGHSCCCTSGDRKDAIRAAQRHLADYTWSASDPVEDWPEWLKAEDRAEIRRNRYWQIAYKRLRERGLSDVEAHQNAFFERDNVAREMTAP